MIQILGLREYSAGGKTRKTEKFFEKNWRAESVGDLLLNLDKYLEQIPENERYNLYYTAASCKEEKGRKLEKQNICPFDIDGIDVNRVHDYHKPVLQALGNLRHEDTGIVFSGNGLQYAVGMLDPITANTYFDKNRKFYKTIVDRVNKALKDNNLPGHADPSVFSPARLLRLPNTENRKPKGTTKAYVIQANLKLVDYILEDVAGFVASDGDHLSSWPTPDTNAVLEGCEFIKHCRDNQKTITEPQWYAMLSIVPRLENGREVSHKYSEGHPDYSHEETEDKIEQALESAGPRSCSSINALWDGCKNCKWHKKTTNPILIKSPQHIATKDNGFYNSRTDADGNVVRTKPAFEDMRRYFEQKHKYLTVGESNLTYVYEDHRWRVMHDTYIKGFAHKILNPPPKEPQRREFLNLIQCTNLKDPDWFTRNSTAKLNFKNGVLNMNNLEFSQHSELFGFKYVLDYSYDQDAKCPKWLKFIDDVTLGRQELKDVLQEYVGYCLSGEDPSFGQKAMILVGDGRNGKSVFLDTMKQLVGIDNYSNLNLEEIKNEANRYQMDGKLFNVAEETPINSLKDSTLFKTLVTGGDMIVKVLYKQPYKTKCMTKIIVSCNDLPSSFDSSYGLYRRMLLVPFDLQITDKLDKKNIRNELWTELPGIFNWAIEGYRRFKKQKSFSDSDVLKNQLRQYRIQSNSVLQWIHECLRFDDSVESYKSTTQMFSEYCGYCDMAKIRPMTKISFSKALKREKDIIERYVRRKDGNGYTGIRILDPSDF